MGEYSQTLSYHHKALKIRQKAFPENHPSLANSFIITGNVYKKMGAYSRALSYFNKALEIRQKAFPENHPSLADSLIIIGNMYKKINKYSQALPYYNKALPYFERALDIVQLTLPFNQPTRENVKAIYEIVKKENESNNSCCVC